MKTIIENIPDMDYSQTKNYTIMQIMPQLASNMRNFDWNSLSNPILRKFLGIILSLKYPDFMNTNMSDIFYTVLTSLHVSAEHTTMLSEPSDYSDFTLLESLIRNRNIHSKVIRLLLFKHHVDVHHVGGKTPTRNVDNWNENVFFLVLREMFMRTHGRYITNQFSKKIYILFRYCHLNNINIDQDLLEVTNSDRVHSLWIINNHNAKWTNNIFLTQVFRPINGVVV